MLLLFGLTYTHVGESISHDYSTLSGVVHLVEIVLPLRSHPKAKSQSWSHGRLPVSFSFRQVRDQFISYLLNRKQRYLFSSLLSSLYKIFKTFLLQISYYFTLCKIHDRILDIWVEIDYCHDSVGSFAFDCIDIVGYSYLYDLFSGNVFKVLLILFLTRFHSFVFGKL